MSTWGLKEISKTLSLFNYWVSALFILILNVSWCRIRSLCFLVVCPFNRLYFLTIFFCWETSPNTVYCLHILLVLPTCSIKWNQKVFYSTQNRYKNHEEKSRKLLKYSSIVKAHLFSFISQILGYIQRTGSQSLLTLSGILRNILHSYHCVVGLPLFISGQALAKYLHMHCDVLKYKHWWPLKFWSGHSKN